MGKVKDVSFQFDDYDPSAFRVYLSAEIKSFIDDLMKFTDGNFESLSKYRPNIEGSSFSSNSLRAISKIPAGETRSYKQVALLAGYPNAYRAIGTACGKNPLPFIIPCHRVVNSGNKVGNYVMGPRLKRQILEYESEIKEKDHIAVV